MSEHATGAAQVDGPQVGALVQLIEQGRTLDALLECLTIPAAVPLARHLPWRVRNHAAMQGVGRWRGRRSLLRDVVARAASISADEIFSHFFQPGRLDPVLGEYVRLLSGQPRYVAALALLSNITLPDKQVLDIGCGMGHFEHYLTQRADPVGAIGVEMNFFQLWMARRWMAPDARFICGNAKMGFPSPQTRVQPWCTRTPVTPSGTGIRADRFQDLRMVNRTGQATARREIVRADQHRRRRRPREWQESAG